MPSADAAGKDAVDDATMRLTAAWRSAWVRAGRPERTVSECDKDEPNAKQTKTETPRNTDTRREKTRRTIMRRNILRARKTRNAVWTRTTAMRWPKCCLMVSTQRLASVADAASSLMRRPVMTRKSMRRPLYLSNCRMDRKVSNRTFLMTPSTVVFDPVQKNMAP